MKKGDVILGSLKLNYLEVLFLSGWLNCGYTILPFIM